MPKPKTFRSSLHMQTRECIANFAWDCTIGAGQVGDDAPQKPDVTAEEELSDKLGHPLSADEKQYLQLEWRICLQDARHP